MEWLWVAWVVALAVAVCVIAWLLHLGNKMRGYVVQAGEATKLLRAASERARAEHPETSDPVEIVEQEKRRHNIRGAGEQPPRHARES